VHEIYGANVRCGKACMTVRTPKPVAYVLDRFKLDQLSVEQAQDAGAELKTNARFSAWDNPTAKTGCGNIQTDVLIGADGVASTVAKQCGFAPLEKMAVAWEGEYEHAAIDAPELVDVFLDFPGLFAWSVPAGLSTVRIGLAVKTTQDLQRHKAKLLDNPAITRLTENGKKVREFYHTIPLKARKQTQKQNVLLVGDAAGQAKATTGGGIVFGSLCAKEAADAVKSHLDGGPLDYQDRWTAKYGKVLKRHGHLRTFLDVLPTGLVSLGLHSLSALGFGRTLEKHGDMDFLTKTNPAANF
jgi:flavin-dependent dehydrogenase